MKHSPASTLPDARSPEFKPLKGCTCTLEDWKAYTMVPGHAGCFYYAPRPGELRRLKGGYSYLLDRCGVEGCVDEHLGWWTVSLHDPSTGATAYLDERFGSQADALAALTKLTTAFLERFERDGSRSFLEFEGLISSEDTPCEG